MRGKTVLLSPANITATSLSLGTNPSSGGDIRLANAGTINFRNAANSADLRVIASNSSNQIILGDSTADVLFAKALVAVGGGSAATLGTIGGSGPATAGQNTWMRWIDSGGTACWVPVWK